MFSRQIEGHWHCNGMEPNPDLEMRFCDCPFRLDQIVIPQRRSSTAYRIAAFDRIFDLALVPSSKECFYRGYVNEDFSSMISINACHGLVSPQEEPSERIGISPV